MSSATRDTYRRTKLVAAGVAVASVLTFFATGQGSAAPAQEAFDNGTGSATALGYKVNPVLGNLSFGITFGESIAGHQNTAATGQSRAINTGVIGLTLAGEGCDGGDPTWPREDQPQPVVARSGDKNAGEPQHGSTANIEQQATATPTPFAEAITTLAPTGDPAGVFVDGGRTITHSGIVDGTVREAFARTELGTITIGGGAVQIKGAVWEAIHRSGSVEETVGSFTVQSVTVGGQAVDLGDDAAAALKEALAQAELPFGVSISMPEVRVEQGIVFVDPLSIGLVPNRERDATVGPVVGALQPVRAALTEALFEADCGFAALVTVADIAVGSVSGAGAFTLDLGGVQTTTAELGAFQFAALPPLPEIPPAAALPSSSAGGAPIASPAVPSVPAAGAAAETPAAGAAPEPIEAERASSLLGERGGWMALIGGGGLALLALTAEGDRRKMRRAQRMIPLEA